MEGLLLNARTISASFVTDIGRPSVSASGSASTQSNPAQLDFNPVLGAIHKKILRLQVVQVVLGLSLMVISAVAILENRILFGLGFGLISAIVTVTSAVVGLNDVSLRTASVWNFLALVSLLPSVYFVFENLISHSPTHNGRTYPHHHNHNYSVQRGYMISTDDDFGKVEQHLVETRRSASAMWIICWLELAHLMILFVSLIFLLFFYRYLNYYRHHL